MLVDFGTRIVNTDHIVSAEAVEVGGGLPGWRLSLSNGGTAVVGDRGPAMEALCGTVIPAPTGFVLIEAYLPIGDQIDEAIYYRESTILAFRVLPGPVSPEPVTIEGEPMPNEDLLIGVLDPNGRCVSAGTPYDSVGEFKASCERVVARRTATAAPDAPAASKPEQVPGAPAPNPLEALRARILAEPIHALKREAPWSAGRSLVDVIAAVRDANPQLHTAGVGYSPQWGWKWKPGDLESHRADMTTPGHVEEFERALRFLSYAGQRFPQTKVNRQRTSYSWKHAAEHVMGGYVSNGMLVAAAYALGFTVATSEDSPNPCINLAEKAIDLDPHRGV